MREEWPLVGRDRELDFAGRVLGTPRLSGLVLAGRPGVGKTRLAKETVVRAAAGGAVTVWARASKAAAGIPLGAVAHLLPEWDGRGMDRARLLHAAASRLVESAKGRRLVVGVDDAALLDDASATLVYQLAANGGAFVVATAEVGYPVPDPIFALWKEGVAERLDINELNRAQTEELVTTVLGGHVDGSTLRELWELTLGNALFLREVVESGLERGTLLRSGGVWRFDGPLTPGARLIEMIEARIGALDADEQTLVELLAFGEPIGSEVLLRLGAHRVLVSTERKGLVVSERSERRLEVRLAHPLYAEVLRRRTSPLRERRTYQILAQAIEAAGARRATDNVRIVTWRLAGGLPVDSALIRGTAEQTMKIDFRHAERLARSAAELDGGFAARYLLGQVLMGAGRAQQAEHTLAGLVGDTTDDDQRARLAVTRVTNLYWGLADTRRAHVVLREAQMQVSTQVAGDELATVQAAILRDSGSCEDSLQLLREVVARPGQSDRVLLQAFTVACPVLARAGRFGDALAAAERGIELTHRTEDPTMPWGPVALESGQCGAYAFAGRLDEAEALAAGGYARALSNHWPTAKAVHASWLGIVALLRGRVLGAQRWLREAVESAQHAPFPFMPALLGELTVATALSGELEAAEALLDQTDAALTEVTQFSAPWAALSRCWVAAARDETSLAVTLAQQTADLARDRGHLQCELVALHDVVRLDSAPVVLDRLQVAAAGAQGRLAPAYLEHAQALVAADGPRLDAVAANFATIGAGLLAAEASAQAARAHEAVDRIGSARASAGRAHAWAQACEGARTPALVRLEAPVDLTKRELEIAQLAASGMTSRTIAERLVVSVRTVDNVLRSVYAKLGVAGRGELAPLVGRGRSPSLREREPGIPARLSSR
ncbi:MAG TPA: LuxR C-terminal-related transcriptional regulator [Pseudonocardiaceae bacterium]